MRFFKKGDILIYGIIIFIFFVIGSMIIKTPNIKGKNVEIFENGKLKYRYKLTKEKQEIILKSILGNEKIIIENYTVKKVDASCPKKICIKHSEIDSVGESIICVPNKQIIKISGNNQELDGFIQ